MIAFKEDIVISSRGRGVGDTHITGRHFGGDTHITSDMSVGIHISRGYTYHCDRGINHCTLFELRASVISAPDLALADRARVLLIQNGRHRDTQHARKVV